MIYIDAMVTITHCKYPNPIISIPQSADLFRASSVWEFPHSSHPAKPARSAQPAQPAKPASQASQPGQLGIEASGLQASMSAILLYRGSNPDLKSPTGRHRADNLLAPTAPGAGSQACHKPLKYR